MGRQYDVHDHYGRKVGEIREVVNYEQVLGGALAGVILLAILLLIFAAVVAFCVVLVGFICWVVLLARKPGIGLLIGLVLDALFAGCYLVSNNAQAVSAWLGAPGSDLSTLGASLLKIYPLYGLSLVTALVVIGGVIYWLRSLASRPPIGLLAGATLGLSALVCAVTGFTWERLLATGLPAGYQVPGFSAFWTYPPPFQGMMPETAQALLLLPLNAVPVLAVASGIAAAGYWVRLLARRPGWGIFAGLALAGSAGLCIYLWPMLNVY